MNVSAQFRVVSTGEICQCQSSGVNSASELLQIKSSCFDPLLNVWLHKWMHKKGYKDQLVNS